MIILNKKPLISKVPNRFQGKTLNKHNNVITVKVSINCDEKVEKLFLNHKCFPFVFCFQK